MKILSAITTTILIALPLSVAGSSLFPSFNKDDMFKFTAFASGDQEVPPVVTSTTGKLSLEFEKDFSEVDFDLDVFDGVAITQAHLHCKVAGDNGPVVVFLLAFNAAGINVDGDLSAGTLMNSDIGANGANCPTPIVNIASLYWAIQKGEIYLNVHSVAHPGGEIRAQVFP